MNYTTPLGFIHGDENPQGESQNGILYTAEYILNAKNNSVAQPDALDLVVNALQKVRGVSPGITHRKPGDLEYQSQDNILAHLYLETVLQKAGTIHSPEAPYLATELKFLDDNSHRFKRIKYVDTSYWEAAKVKQNKWGYIVAKLTGTEQLCVNPHDPSKFCFFSWYGRNPATLALIDLVAQGKTTLFRKLALLVSLQIFENKYEETDSKKLGYLCWHIVANTVGIKGLYKTGFNLWQKRVGKIYPYGMKQVYEVYYGDHNHPTILNAKLDFELRGEKNE